MNSAVQILAVAVTGVMMLSAVLAAIGAIILTLKALCFVLC